MAAAAAAAAGALLGGLGQAFSHQSRPSGSAGATSRTDTSTAAISAATSPKARRLAVKNAKDERLMALVTDPQVMGLLVVFGGLWASQAVPWSQDPVRNNAVGALAGSSAVLMGLGRAGVGDLTSVTMAAAAAAALGLTGEGSLVDWPGGGEIGGDKWPATLYVGGLPLASAFGPIPLFQKLLSAGGT